MGEQDVQFQLGKLPGGLHFNLSFAGRCLFQPYADSQIIVVRNDQLPQRNLLAKKIFGDMGENSNAALDPVVINSKEIFDDGLDVERRCPNEAGSTVATAGAGNKVLIVVPTKSLDR